MALAKQIELRPCRKSCAASAIDCAAPGNGSRRRVARVARAVGFRADPHSAVAVLTAREPFPCTAIPAARREKPRPSPHRLREIHDANDTIVNGNESRLKVPRT
ncbi:hypothetical protein [Burkholderia multivorans]|uniref:hypothetical protein n=1 Tax=Burkholderia multivorans TaxID=87883 RepID=UPI0020B3ABF6|nr:hypothetical protein [Burkholderia multivorans]